MQKTEIFVSGEHVETEILRSAMLILRGTIRIKNTGPEAENVDKSSRRLEAIAFVSAAGED